MNAEEALQAIVAAWESLPGGQRYTVQEIERWLRERMGPAIDEVRATLSRNRDDDEQTQSSR